ncbi:MAG: hypothetical protein HY858_06810 [Candidatus Solibacter usitatus]|nr:hypothetical protein [Candidatus Solibacter usitatus]
MARFLILAAALTGAVWGQGGVPPAAQVEQVTREIAEITGLAVKRPIPMETITREGWKKWVEDEIRQNVKPEEIRVEELALKMIGLAPRDFDLKKATVDLLGEQAAAVYDHRRKKMLLVEGGAAGALGDAVLVHELAHAVADQHFNMRRFLDKGPKPDEAQTARLAVVEGQAMWIMLEWQMRRTGQSLKGNTAAIEAVLPSMGQLAAETYPVFSGAPLYMRETLMFPYTAGMMFQQAAVEKYGQKGFAEVLQKPPVSTRQVIHPEVYFSGQTPVAASLPEVETRSEYRVLTKGSIGELDFRVLFQQYGAEKQAREAAAAWRGAAFELLEHRKEGRAVLRWGSEWSGEASAREALKLYGRVLEGKSKGLRWKEQGETRLRGSNEDGEFEVAVEGASLRAVEGMKAGTSRLY